MKKKFLLFLATVSALTADVVSVTPYAGVLGYENDVTKSIKEKGRFYGLYASVGDLSYLLEADIARTDITYKETVKNSYPDLEDIAQYDATLAYGRFWSSFYLKGGVHYINSNDVVLNDGIVGILSLGGYKFAGYDKYSYGVEGFFSYYKDGHDDSLAYTQKAVSIYQISPYLSAYNVFGGFGNLFAVKGDYQLTPDYVKNSYFSYTISDTLYYKSLYVNLRWRGGEMKTGVTNGGFAINNTLDLQKSGFGAEAGYYFSYKAILSVGYERNSYIEYGATQEGKWDKTMASFTYKF